MKYCKELDKEFDSDEQMLKELWENKDRIIGLKKSAVKFSDGLDVLELKSDIAEKAGIELADGYVYPVINTTKVLDGHGDLHIDGLWNKTLKEQAGKIYYAINHSMKIGSIVAYPKDVTASAQTLKWSELGKNYEGSTQALIFKVKIQPYANKDAVEVIENKLPAQNSVSMRYVKIEMAVNSEDKEYKDAKKIYDEFEPQIANKADFDEIPKYFWVVKEAEIAREGSMVSIGSNQETPILYPKSDEPSKDTQELEEEAAEKSLSDSDLALVGALNEFINN